MTSLRPILSVLLLRGLLLLIPTAPARAGSATWNLNPTNGDWNTAANWTPATVPGDPADIATLGLSNLKNLQISANVDLDSLTFSPGGSPYSVTLNPGVSLNLWGDGVINDSGQPQTVLLPSTFSTVTFRNNATTGDFLSYAITGSGIYLNFLQTSSAGSANFAIDGPFNEDDPGIYFFDDSTAANGTFTIKGNSFLTLAGDSTAANAVFTTSNGGRLMFEGGKGGNCKIINEGASSSGGFAGQTSFSVTGVNAEAATITAHGGAVDGADGATVDFFLSSAGSATILVEGGPVNGAGGASLIFKPHASAGNATITVTGGMNGGEGGLIQFISGSDGGTARLELLGENATLDLSTHKAPGMAIGSIQGDGVVNLGALNLTVGSNSLSTTFSGILQGVTGSSLRKNGNGSLTLTGANTYSGGTTIEDGKLTVNNRDGSGTGSGPVQVNAGRLSGRGVITGAVTIGTGSGTGAFLAPSGESHRPTTLTVQSALSFKADATYICNVNTKKTKADKVLANGVTIEGRAQFSFGTIGNQNKKLATGQVFVAISNTAATPINGTFANLPDDSTVTVGNNTFQANYEGGDGNDLTLTVVP